MVLCIWCFVLPNFSLSVLNPFVLLCRFLLYGIKDADTWYVPSLHFSEGFLCLSSVLCNLSLQRFATLLIGVQTVVFPV